MAGHKKGERKAGRPRKPIIGSAEHELIFQWQLENQSHDFMARQLGVAQTTVSYHIRQHLDPRWTEKLNVKIEEEAARIANIESVAWRQFWESCKNEEREKIKEVAPEVSDKMTPKQIKALTAVVTERELTRIGQSGNPVFLRQVFECIEWRCKMAGIVPPEKHEHTVTEMRVAGRGREEWAQEQLAKRAAVLLTEPSNGNGNGNGKPH